MKTREIKTKRPWKRIRPQGYLAHGHFSAEEEPVMPHDGTSFNIVTQADFLREYYPTGHSINDPRVYPDIYREEIIPILDENGEETGDTTRRVYKEYVPRYAFAFQQIIALKQTIHVCGNDIQFELNKSKPTDHEQTDFDLFREGWLSKDMEIAFYESVKSVKITGDTAFVGYLDGGKFRYKTLSYLNGDTLYPHYDSITGKLSLFARSFFDYDDNGDVVVEWLEVWDTTHLTRFKKSGDKYRTVAEKFLGTFGLTGYTMVSRKPHGFPRVPVAYHRCNDGACWTPSQESIDGYELSFSQMAHNNQAFGEPILVLQGEGENIDIQHDLNGTIKTLSMGADDKASYLTSQSASESYMKQLETLYRMIYEQSFAVIPPEVRSGDLPGVAIKLLYSPAYEKAMSDAAELQPFLNEVVEIFKYGFGVEKEKTVDFANIAMKWWVKPYIHINESAMVTDLATAVQNGFCSKQTASERISFYTTVGEWDRIVKEAKSQQEADLLFQLKSTAQDKKIDNEPAHE